VIRECHLHLGVYFEVLTLLGLAMVLMAIIYSVGRVMHFNERWIILELRVLVKTAQKL